MKTWLVSLFVIIALIGMGIKVQNILERQSADLIKKLDQVQLSINASLWPSANAKLKPLTKQWSATKPIWALLIHHQEIDAIDSALIRLLGSVASESLPDSQTSSGELRHFLQHIPQREEFNLINIF